MTHHTSPRSHMKSHDEEISSARNALESAITSAHALLDQYPDEARFRLDIPLHPFHQALREEDETWTKQSLLDILESLNEALETRIWMAADGVLLPYPVGDAFPYPAGHTPQVFHGVLHVVAPLLIRIANIIADAKREQHIPHEPYARDSWHKACGFLRKLSREVKDEARMIEHARGKGNALSLLPPHYKTR